MTATPADAGSPSAGAETCTCGHPRGAALHGRNPFGAGHPFTPAVLSPEDTVEPQALRMDWAAGSAWTADNLDAPPTPLAVRTGEDDEADVEPTREDRGVAMGLVLRARAAETHDQVCAVRDRIASEIATERALSSRPLVSGTANRDDVARLGRRWETEAAQRELMLTKLPDTPLYAVERTRLRTRADTYRRCMDELLALLGGDQQPARG